MPLDPSISLQVQPPNPGALASNPLGAITALTGIANTQQEMQARSLAIQQQQNVIQQWQQEFAGRQKLGALMSSAPDTESGLRAAAQDPLIARYPALLNEYRAMQSTFQDVQNKRAQLPLIQAQIGEVGARTAEAQTDAARNVAETGKINASAASDAYTGLLNLAVGGVNDPGAAKRLVADKLSIYPKGIRDAVGGAAADAITALTDGLPSDTGKWSDSDWSTYNGRLSSTTMAAGASPETIRAARGLIAPVEKTIITPSGAPQETVLGGGLAAPRAGGGGGGAAAAASPVNDLTVRLGNGTEGQMAGVAPPTGGNPLSSPAAAAAATLLPAGPTPATTEYNVGRTKDFAAHEAALDDRVDAQAIQHRNATEILSAAKQAQTGGGADVYKKLGEVLQGFGVSNEVVDKWANGSLPASQVIDKVSLSNAWAQLRQSLEHMGKINQTEFAETLSKNPNLLTDPRAIVQIFNLWNDYRTKDLAEQSSLDKYKTVGGDLRRWPTVWQNSDFMKKWAPTEPFSAEGVKGTGPSTKRDWSKYYSPASGVASPVPPQ